MSVSQNARLRTDVRGTPAPWLVDALLGAVVALVVSVQIASHVGGEPTPGTVYLWALGLGALMMMRRKRPSLVVTLTVAGFYLYYGLGYPPIGVAAPVAAAVFSAAERGRLLTAVLASSAVVGGSVTYRLVAGQDPRFILGYDLPGHLLLLLSAIALGDSFRSRRSLKESTRRITALTADKVRRETEEQSSRERLQVAQDLHDSIGHSLTIIWLHSSVGQESLLTDPQRTQHALTIIEATTRESLSQLRNAVTSLRGKRPHQSRSPSLRDLDSVVTAARRVGFDATTEVSLSNTLEPDVEVAAFRIVQEAVTNAVRHSGGTRIKILINGGDDRLDIEIVNDGVSVPATDPPVAGHGIAGMKERLLSLGGWLEAGPAPDGGFRVKAVLPLRSQQ